MSMFEVIKHMRATHLERQAEALVEATLIAPSDPDKVLAHLESKVAEARDFHEFTEFDQGVEDGIRKYRERNIS